MNDRSSCSPSGAAPVGGATGLSIISRSRSAYSLVTAAREVGSSADHAGRRYHRVLR